MSQLEILRQWWSSVLTRLWRDKHTRCTTSCALHFPGFWGRCHDDGCVSVEGSSSIDLLSTSEGRCERQRQKPETKCGGVQIQWRKKTRECGCSARMRMHSRTMDRRPLERQKGRSTRCSCPWSGVEDGRMIRSSVATIDQKAKNRSGRALIACDGPRLAGLFRRRSQRASAYGSD